MAITLWGRKSSVNVQKAVWALEELQPDYEIVELGGRFGGLDAPAYRALNPHGKVPTLRDGSLVVWESHAIVRYLAARYGAGTLWPELTEQRAGLDQWTDWTATSFQPIWLEVFYLVIRTAPAQQDRAAIDRAVAAASEAYRHLDRRLGELPFLGGDGLGYADIVAGASMFRWMTMPIERPPLPHLEAWYERLMARPAFRQAVCVSYAEMTAR